MTKHLLTALALVAVLVSGCDSADLSADATAASARKAKTATPAGTPHDGVYALIAKTSLPDDLETLVSAAGGTLTNVLPEIGVAFAKAESPSFQARAAASIRGLEAVAPDLLIEWVDDPRVQSPDGSGAPANLDGSLAEDETFGFLQWPLEAIHAPSAWGQGLTGEGVRVAIIDGGIWDQHFDLDDQIDRSASRSFVPGFEWNEDNPNNTFWHGTHVAGIVAAEDNGGGTVGVAPGATLIGLKALHDFGNGSGSGSFEWITEAIYYASTPLEAGGAGADIINMSLGATLDSLDVREERAVAKELRKMIDRATRYAWQQGVLVVASAGNGATNFDDATTLLKLPAENQHVLSVSATGPIGWALGADNFERLAYYSDFGKSLVDIAAPGGTFGLFAEFGNASRCTVSGPTRSINTFCVFFDEYFSTVRGGLIDTDGDGIPDTQSTGSYNWAQGTSMAAPTVAGVAALVMQQRGTGNPAATMTTLQSTATDLGKPGQDEVYGHGFVNAATAVGATVAAN